MGKDNFYSNPSFEYLHDYPVPPCFIFIFNTFLELYSCSTIIGGLSASKNMTWQDIESYCTVRKINLTQIELNYLLMIKDIAEQEISELEKEENKD